LALSAIPNGVEAVAVRGALIRPGCGETTPRSGQPDNEIIFLCEDDEDDANEASPTIQFMFPKDDTDEA
jgi:hypothetical protein